jgi:hypothetical protein
MSGIAGYDEVQAASTNIFFEEGYRLMDHFILD